MTLEQNRGGHYLLTSLLFCCSALPVLVVGGKNKHQGGKSAWWWEFVDNCGGGGPFVPHTCVLLPWKLLGFSLYPIPLLHMSPDAKHASCVWLHMRCVLFTMCALAGTKVLIVL